MITTDALRSVAEEAETAAASGNTMAMAYVLGRIAEWALTAARVAEEADAAPAEAEG